MKRFFSWILSIFGVLFLVVAIALCLIMAVPPLIGMGSYPVASDTMEPEIAAGSLVIVDQVDPATLVKDDIITYERTVGGDTSAPITHRVVSNDVDDEEILAKGDYNTAVDPQPVEYSNVLGKLKFTIPVLGNVILGFGSLPGKIAAGVWVVVGFIMAIAGVKLRKPPKPEIKVLYI